MLVVKQKKENEKPSTIFQSHLYTQTNLGRRMKWDFGNH